MFEKYNDACCIEFYNAYDSIMKNIMGHHYEFYYFFKKKFEEIQLTEYAHKATIESFIDFIWSETLDAGFIPPEESKRRKTLSKRIFDSCYRDLFKTSSMPSDLGELKQSLFQSELKCLKLFFEFENVNRCLVSNDFSSDDKELLLYLIEQFIFVRTFASFVYKYRKIESIDFFKRFFFIYPFNKEDSPCDYNREWYENHNQKFEIIKNHINSPENELQSAREWFKEQLEKVDFAALSEKNKSVFFKEMFVTFGNISSKKTGDAKGFRVPLNHLFYLGRYYNVHFLPRLYVEKEREVLESIAHETWQRICGLKLTSKDEAEEAKRKNISGKMSEQSEKELYGNKAPRVKIERLMKQFSHIEQIEPNDNYNTILNKSISCLDVSALNIKSVDDVATMLSDKLRKMGINDKVDKGNKEVAINMILGQKDVFLEMIIDASMPLSAPLCINKSGSGLMTHYDLRNVPNIRQVAQELLEKVIQSALKS